MPAPTPIDRTLTILADGEPVSAFARAKLQGHEQLGLFPSLFLLRLWNVGEEDYLLLSRCRDATVRLGDAVLLSGPVADVFRQRTKSGTETHVAISPGLSLWESRISLSVEAGVTVSDTVRRLLAASGTGISLLSFPGDDPVVSRPQAFFGRAAECVLEALGKADSQISADSSGSAGSSDPAGSSASSSSLSPATSSSPTDRRALASALRPPAFRRTTACLVPSGLCVIPPSGLPVSMILSGEDLTDVPSFTRRGDMILRTAPAGWTLGKCAEVRYGGTETRGLISERLLDLDTGGGPWHVELLLTQHVSF